MMRGESMWHVEDDERREHVASRWEIRNECRFFTR